MSSPNLWVPGGKDAGPLGRFRRLKGSHPVKTGTLRSREGSTLLASLSAHSLFRFADSRFAGASTQLYRDGASIRTGLNGNRLAFVKMPPRPGVADYLFVSGGGSLFKVDSSGAVTNWGIAAAVDGFAVPVAATATLTINGFDVAADWTGANITLSDETTIFISTKSMKMVMAANTRGTATITLGSPVDFTDFGFADESYLQFWFYANDPFVLDSIELQIDTGLGTFVDADVQSFTFVVKADPKLGGIVNTPGTIALLGAIGDKVEVGGTAEEVFDRLERIRRDQSVRAEVDILTSSKVVELGSEKWQLLRAPRKLFTRSGVSVDWTNVKGLRLALRTNGVGSITAYVDLLQQHGSGPLRGDYKYHITYFNSTTGHRGNPNPTVVEHNGADLTKSILSSFPNAATVNDAQIDKLEIWRTLGDGTRFFKVGDRLVVDIASFTDDAEDIPNSTGFITVNSMQALELPIDNDPPAATYDDCFGPHNAAMFWTRDSTVGARGRVYYSPIGRPESVKGFIEVTSDDDPVQKGVMWGNFAWAFSEEGIFQILGSDPYTSRRVEGAPGTINPFTIVPTEIGIIYESRDGVRVFNGVRSKLIAPEAVQILFRGSTAEGISAFSGVVATFGRGEYFISDSTTTLALDVARGTWRNVGVGADAMHFEDDTEELIVSFGGAYYTFEEEGKTQDGSTAISFEAEPVSIKVSEDVDGIIQYLFVDANTNGQAITPTLILDGVETTLPTFQTSSRSITEYKIFKSARLIGVRLTGSLPKALEIFDMSADVYVPSEAARLQQR